VAERLATGYNESMPQEPPIPKELWDQIPSAAQAALLALFGNLQSEVTALRQQVADLTARLGQNSHNSSKPPSSDTPAVKRRPPREPSGRHQGGQPGHELHCRPLLPPDEEISRQPTACRRCGEALVGCDPQPLRHQVIELPPIKPRVTEYQLHRLVCPRCGTSTCASLPAGVPTGHQGPRLQAVLAVLTGAYRLSKDQAETLCADLFRVPICAGTICQLEQQTTAALTPVVEQLREHVKTEHANLDETGWREEGQRAWLWVAVTALCTVFHIARSRGGAVARSLLGPGLHWVVTSDRFSAYKWLALRRRQLCWAHLRRDFQAMLDRHNSGSVIGQELLLFSDDVFYWWYRVRDGTLQRSSLRTYIAGQRPWLRTLLEKGSVCGCAKTAAVCRELLKLEPALWTFLRVEGVEPTNNAAERALRHAVLWRKSSYGTASVKGSQYVASILSVVATCRQQGRNVLEFVTACCQARLQGWTPPSLLPVPA
jgi:transposase